MVNQLVLLSSCVLGKLNLLCRRQEGKARREQNNPIVVGDPQRYRVTQVCETFHRQRATRNPCKPKRYRFLLCETFHRQEGQPTCWYKYLLCMDCFLVTPKAFHRFLLCIPNKLVVQIPFLLVKALRKPS